MQWLAGRDRVSPVPRRPSANIFTSPPPKWLKRDDLNEWTKHATSRVVGLFPNELQRSASVWFRVGLFTFMSGLSLVFSCIFCWFSIWLGQLVFLRISSCMFLCFVGCCDPVASTRAVDSGEARLYVPSKALNPRVLPSHFESAVGYGTYLSIQYNIWWLWSLSSVHTTRVHGPCSRPFTSVTS